MEGEDGRRRDSELSIVGSLMPWAGRKLSSASIQGGTNNPSNCGRQNRAGSLSQHEELRLHKHLRVVRLLLLNVFVVLVMWIPITVVMVLIYIDGSRPTQDTNFFLRYIISYFFLFFQIIKFLIKKKLQFRSHHFIWAVIIAQFNTIVNPLLYGVSSENFRACFAKLWHRENKNNNNNNTSNPCTNNNNNALYGCGNNETTTADPTATTTNNSTNQNQSKSIKLQQQDNLRSGKNCSRSQGKCNGSVIGRIAEVPCNSERS